MGLVVSGVAVIYWPAALILLGVFFVYAAIKLHNTRQPEPATSVPAFNSSYN